ncbi:MAG: hypothetical protein PHD51_02385 [Patescibacteria group bacterium]|nr:hypothetical protein [Patescibacteria group bacterium]MDD5490291.1 hypothetical protein [Patescibacteria group bacterium]
MDKFFILDCIKKVLPGTTALIVMGIIIILITAIIPAERQIDFFRKISDFLNCRRRY